MKVASLMSFVVVVAAHNILTAVVFGTIGLVLAAKSGLFNA